MGYEEKQEYLHMNWKFDGVKDVMVCLHYVQGAAHNAGIPSHLSHQYLVS